MRKHIIALAAAVGLLACVQAAEAGPFRAAGRAIGHVGHAAVHGAAHVGRAVVGRERRQARRSSGGGVAVFRGRCGPAGCR